MSFNPTNNAGRPSSVGSDIGRDRENVQQTTGTNPSTGATVVVLTSDESDKHEFTTNILQTNPIAEALNARLNADRNESIQPSDVSGDATGLALSNNNAQQRPVAGASPSPSSSPSPNPATYAADASGPQPIHDIYTLYSRNPLTFSDATEDDPETPAKRRRFEAPNNNASASVSTAASATELPANNIAISPAPVTAGGAVQNGMPAALRQTAYDYVDNFHDLLSLCSAPIAWKIAKLNLAATSYTISLDGVSLDDEGAREMLDEFLLEKCRKLPQDAVLSADWVKQIAHDFLKISIAEENNQLFQIVNQVSARVHLSSAIMQQMVILTYASINDDPDQFIEDLLDHYEGVVSQIPIEERMAPGVSETSKRGPD